MGTVIATPFGPLSAIADADVLVAAGFGDSIDALRRHLARPDAGVRASAGLGTISSCIRDYLEGEVNAIDGIQVRARGSDTMQRLWTRLRAVPAGTTVSYAGLGGDPRRARVAAAACARNPVCVVVPCHRVIRTDGGLGGFGGGLPAKRWLLDHEARYRSGMGPALGG
ncbi:MAG: methylated-DNA--[protein]-cysteine S-methyltransferase [Actinobacteria bacterium]|nr:methylated-DNA--[protein]-cysteine S-methyltransferase [Actinomycetota bacterium]